MTFKKVIDELSPAVFFIEETKFKDEGKIKLEKYHIFERIRKNRDGGGLALRVSERAPTCVGKRRG